MKTKTQKSLLIALVILGAIYAINQLFFDGKKSTNFDRQIVYFDLAQQDSIVISKGETHQVLVKTGDKQWALKVNDVNHGQGMLPLAERQYSSTVEPLAKITATKLAKAKVTTDGLKQLGLQDSVATHLKIYQGSTAVQHILIGETKRIELEKANAWNQPSLTYFRPKGHGKLYATDKPISFVKSQLLDQMKQMSWLPSEIKVQELVAVDVTLGEQQLKASKQADKWVKASDTSAVLPNLASNLGSLASSQSIDFSFHARQNPIGSLKLESTEVIDGDWEIYSTESAEEVWITQPKKQIAYRIKRETISNLFQ